MTIFGNFGGGSPYKLFSPILPNFTGETSNNRAAIAEIAANFAKYFANMTDISY
jgi:hypothetical protein